MESILKADIFFFISSISIVIISIFILIALFYFIKVLRNFYKISNLLKNYAEDTESELRDMANHVRESPIFTFIFGRAKIKREPEKRSKE